MQEYHIHYQSPIGSGEGMLYLETASDKLTGKLSVFQKTFSLENGIIKDNQFQFHGTVHFMGKALSYSLRGIMNSNALNATVHTSLGTITATGNLVH